MKRKFKVSNSRPLADFLPTVTIKAKDLATEMTNHTVQISDLRGQTPIGERHVQNNKNVRQALTTSGIYPETLPPAEDIRKVERRLKSEEKTLPKGAACIPKA
jgi:DNA-damage-inducible protein D